MMQKLNWSFIEIELQYIVIFINNFLASEVLRLDS